MYLSLLKETEKELFLCLAYDLSSVDDVLGEEEKQMLKLYCDEMEIEDYNLVTTNRNEIVQEIAVESTQKNKKIIIFELIGLAICDDNYDATEKSFIVNLAEYCTSATMFNKFSNCIFFIWQYYVVTP